jgi:hypothetical protein
MVQLWRAPAAARLERPAERNLQIELALPAPLAVGAGREPAPARGAAARRLPRPPNGPRPAARWRANS